MASWSHLRMEALKRDRDQKKARYSAEFQRTGGHVEGEALKAYRRWVKAEDAIRDYAHAGQEEFFQKKTNPCSRVKGRKVKGGRSVTLHNMASVTIIKRQNGTVSIRGVRK